MSTDFEHFNPFRPVWQVERVNIEIDRYIKTLLTYLLYQNDAQNEYLTSFKKKLRRKGYFQWGRF